MRRCEILSRATDEATLNGAGIHSQELLGVEIRSKFGGLLETEDTSPVLLRPFAVLATIP